MPTIKQEHTPGPWAVDHDGHDAEYVYVMANDSTITVAAMHPAFSNDPRGGMTMADARLIASAPDLLAACEAALPAIEWYVPFRDPALGDGVGDDADNWRMVSALRAAIAKARG